MSMQNASSASEVLGEGVGVAEIDIDGVLLTDKLGVGEGVPDTGGVVEGVLVIDILGVVVGVIDTDGVLEGVTVAVGEGVGQEVVESTTAYPVILCSLITATVPFLSI